MEAVELGKIKEYQKEFQSLFNKKLEIDWESMNNVLMYKNGILVRSGDKKVEVKFSDILKDCATRHNADIKVIVNRKNRIGLSAHFKERDAVIEYCQIVYANNLNVSNAAAAINRDRSCVYYFASLK